MAFGKHYLVFHMQKPYGQGILLNVYSSKRKAVSFAKGLHIMDGHSIRVEEWHSGSDNYLSTERKTVFMRTPEEEFNEREIAD